MARNNPGGNKSNKKKAARSARNRLSGKYAAQRARTEANKARRRGESEAGVA